jgi:hypothetical protein
MNEDEIQKTFVEWLETKHRYNEVTSDPNGGAGAICDSIGWIAETPILIEFKCNVVPSIVAYTPQRSSSIERKVKVTLEKLHQGDLLNEWNKTTVPLIWIVSEKISKQAVIELEKLFDARSSDWSFNYEVGTWSGKSYQVMCKGPEKPIHLDSTVNVKFEEMPWPKENRKPKRNLDDFRMIAEKNGSSALFDKIIALAQHDGLLMEFNRSSINLKAKTIENQKYVNVIGIWPLENLEKKSLCVSADSKRLSKAFPSSGALEQMMPGQATKPLGYLGKTAYLSNELDVLEFWSWATGKTKK